MAQMIPPTLEDDHGSFGERKVFEALKKKLPKEYIVFHSIRWNGINEKKTVIWGECDFTIFHPEYGILIVEVKAGGIECVNNEWSYIRTDNNEKHDMKHPPLEQADREIRYKFKDLVSDTLPKSKTDPQYCLVEPAAWFPSINKKDLVGELPMEYRDEIVLYENALDNPQKYIEEIYGFYGGKRHTRLSLDSCDKLIKAFAPYFQAVPSLKSKREELEESFVRLTNQQKYLIDYLEEQKIAAIQGAAGTGKTMLAVEKAKKLAERESVLFLCYNHYLKEYLQQLKADSPEDYKGISFYNLQQLACNKMHVTSVTNEDISYFLENFVDYEWEYKSIVIDEAQDFKNEHLNKLYEIAVCLDGSFYAFYDKKQFVQGEEFPKWLLDAECRLVLSINCRNTYQIADTSGKPVQVPPRVKDRAVVGNMPNFYVCSEEKAALKAISKLIDRYRAANYPYKQIVILTMKTEKTSILSGVEKVGNHLIGQERGERSVLFTTARKFKGLEADAIIFIDMDADSFKPRPEDDPKCLFYVGCSRARHQLDIVFVGDDNDLLELCSDVSDKEYPNGKIAVSRCLNVKLASAD